jgi:hypothetical protein
MVDFEVNQVGSLSELRPARALGRVIEEELQKGNSLPDEIMRAYKELYAHWQWQISRELS